jgi:hypothetical protein
MASSIYNACKQAHFGAIEQSWRNARHVLQQASVQQIHLFSFQIRQSTASELAFATINMLRFDIFRAALQIRLLPQISAQFSRMPSRAKIQDANAPYLLYQRPLANRAFSIFIQSDNSTLDNDSRRKWKKLLEPSHFDSAVTFEEAFGQKVVT